jgi:hypothetical protein
MELPNMTDTAERDGGASSMGHKSASPTLSQLRNAAARSQMRKFILVNTRDYMASISILFFFFAEPFFSRNQVFDFVDTTVESDEDDTGSDEGSDSAREECEGSASGIYQFIFHCLIVNSSSSYLAWFKRPRSMPLWLYEYFATTITPLINRKDGRHLMKPLLFSDGRPYTPPTFWINPPEPTISLSLHQFDPTLLWRPRIFIWLPHFFVKELLCPTCGDILQKNGAAHPRRITDINDNFYAITWKYYCRKKCKKTFRGWSSALLESLPAYLRLAFPAVLSRYGGLSRQVISQLRVSNQHKMGPTGYRSLLLENHTLRFSMLQAQYLEAMFEMVSGRPDVATSQTQSTLHAFLPTKTLPSFGNFSDSDKYCGFVPSISYLARMMNKAIERDEPDANQHTACLAPDQIAIDDSHKVVTIDLTLFPSLISLIFVDQQVDL